MIQIQPNTRPPVPQVQTVSHADLERALGLIEGEKKFKRAKDCGMQIRRMYEHATTNCDTKIAVTVTCREHLCSKQRRKWLAKSHEDAFYAASKLKNPTLFIGSMESTELGWGKLTGFRKELTWGSEVHFRLQDICPKGTNWEYKVAWIAEANEPERSDPRFKTLPADRQSIEWALDSVCTSLSDFEQCRQLMPEYLTETKRRQFVQGSSRKGRGRNKRSAGDGAMPENSKLREEIRAILRGDDNSHGMAGNNGTYIPHLVAAQEDCDGAESHGHSASDESDPDPAIEQISSDQFSGHFGIIHQESPIASESLASSAMAATNDQNEPLSDRPPGLVPTPASTPAVGASKKDTGKKTPAVRCPDCGHCDWSYIGSYVPRGELHLKLGRLGTGPSCIPNTEIALVVDDDDAYRPVSIMVNIPNNPSSLGLPFNSWRPHQAETIANIANSAQPTTLFESPTGSGKAAVAVGVLMATGSRGMILTHSMALQDQYASTYSSVASIIGSGNFARDEAGGLPDEYVDMRNRGMAAQITVTNYSWFLNAANRWKIPQNLDWLILDEAHLIEDVIGNFITVELDRSTCREVGLDLPRTEKFLEMHVFCLQKLPKIDEALDHVRKSASKEFQIIDELEHLQWVMRLITQPGGNWLMTDDDGCLKFKPSRPGWFTSNLLLRHAPRHLLMSGTILDHEFFARTLGIRHPTSIILPNTINAAQRPVVYRPVTSMSKRNRAAGPGALIAMRESIDGIANHHQGQRGVIHTSNYEISRYLMEHSAFKDRFISHEDAATREHALRRFLGTPGAVLVSPSMDVGTDLPGDSARWQIICKIPFPYLGDEAVMKRMKSDTKWYAWKTLTRLIQACGRIVRGEDDYGTTYILDSDFSNLHSHFHLVPDWFWDAFQ